ncbi:uncharacterized protein CELE_T04H1.13 [Caenorhabditis elegans]|uniref:Uncharacterized protein n=1 Tax=Caenorhabditis elegans TaxID=6239 RepID=A0A2K5ATX6_CAEEL|nr:Uncharacterized protein CELE_T04H1.13 [Caenorhabditis elegans]SPC47965.1 Uncharacterized protein CELE_T04H1.13 [Caenorhabditis elegans]|eukprot:NP_001348776.1 Uncharacterized protein CELE_T04H1.13 [Caenorhabditis elegans]
MIDRIRREQ